MKNRYLAFAKESYEPLEFRGGFKRILGARMSCEAYGHVGFAVIYDVKKGLIQDYYERNPTYKKGPPWPTVVFSWSEWTPW